ncbi:hypothetical protein HK102_005239 [Quaeritorhiza haematococci]|nr:hypothetical protein HK102_005239 [Quaeritorhiza haematococci]
MVMSRTNWTLLLKFKLIGTIVGLLVGTTFVADALLIRAFNATGSELFAVEKDQEPTDITFVTACALHDIVVRNPDITGKVNVVGWGAVGDAPICNGKPPSPGQPPLPCPDVIILGTTQISGRFYKGELESMEEYFASYAQESQTGMNIIDDFSKGVYYDYKIGDTWTGVPLSTDVRAVSYNRTVFKELKLKEPPPMESWGEYDEEWTWDTFLEYATILKNSGKSSAGFKLLSIVHEEFHCLMTTVGRLVNVRLIESNGTCGLRKANWYDALEKYVRKPLQDGIFNHMYDRNMLASVPRLQNFLKNTDPNSSVIAELDVFPMLSQIAQWDFGNVLDGMGLLPVAGIYAAWLSNPNETGYAFPPRGFTFLGGTGLVIPKYATQKETSWDFIVHMTDKKESFIRRWNNAGAVPPLESAADHPVYKTPFHTFSRALMKRAIPDHYPGAPYRFYKELDTMAPFRMMLLEMALKNFSAEVATRRACEVIELLARKFSSFFPSAQSLFGAVASSSGICLLS